MSDESKINTNASEPEQVPIMAAYQRFDHAKRQAAYGGRGCFGHLWSALRGQTCGTWISSYRGWLRSLFSTVWIGQRVWMFLSLRPQHRLTLQMRSDGFSHSWGRSSAGLWLSSMKLHLIRLELLCTLVKLATGESFLLKVSKIITIMKTDDIVF